MPAISKAKARKLTVSYQAYMEYMGKLVPGMGTADEYNTIAYWAESLNEAQNATGVEIIDGLANRAAFYRSRAVQVQANMRRDLERQPQLPLYLPAERREFVTGLSDQ